jgi:prepilin-type N-terminal cleavage/methylation domain-containing protein
MCSHERRRGEARPAGFTLIELLVVIAIVGVLAAIAIQAFAVYRQKAYDSRAIHDLGNAAIAEEAYYAVNFQYVEVPLITADSDTVVDVPGFVVSAGVQLEVEVPADNIESFIARATAFRGSGRTYEYDSMSDTIRGD